MLTKPEKYGILGLGEPECGVFYLPPTVDNNRIPLGKRPRTTGQVTDESPAIWFAAVGSLIWKCGDFQFTPPKSATRQCVTTDAMLTTTTGGAVMAAKPHSTIPQDVPPNSHEHNSSTVPSHIDHDAISNIAHWHHFPNGSLSLPRGRVAAMLDRRPRGTNGTMFLCNLETDHITCGLETIWKTGAREILRQLLEIVTEDDLDWRNFVGYFMWWHHVKRQAAAGYDMSHSQPDTIWRNGRQVADSWPEHLGLAAGVEPVKCRPER